MLPISEFCAPDMSALMRSGAHRCRNFSPPFRKRAREKLGFCAAPGVCAQHAPGAALPAGQSQGDKVGTECRGTGRSLLMANVLTRAAAPNPSLMTGSAISAGLGCASGRRCRTPRGRRGATRTLLVARRPPSPEFISGHAAGWRALRAKMREGDRLLGYVPQIDYSGRKAAGQ